MKNCEILKAFTTLMQYYSSQKDYERLDLICKLCEELEKGQK